MKLTWYGHSCFKLESACGSVVFDPYAPGSVPGWVLPDIEADEVICSHGHSDHNFAEGVRLTGGAFTGGIVRVHGFHDHHGGSRRGENTMTLIEADGVRAAHLGDIGCPLTDEQLAALGRVDVLMLPVGGYYTVGPEEAMGIVRALRPAITVPMHYRAGAFGYEVIGPVEPFLELAGSVKRIEGEYEISLSDAPATVVFAP